MDPQSNPYQTRARFARPPQSLASRIATLLIGIGLLVVGVMFSLVALAVAAVVGSALLGWFWWKTRALRKAMREAGPTPGMGEGGDHGIIEGEFVRETTQRPPLRS